MKIDTSFILAFLILLSCLIIGVPAADNVPPSPKPPKYLKISNVPQFLIFGYDDQATVEGMQAVLDIFKKRKNPPGRNQAATFDGTPTRCSFYTTSAYLGSELSSLHKKAITDGFEIGNHTQSHETSFPTTESEWKNEIQQCNSALVSAGVPQNQIVGFRTPKLEYSNATFKTLISMGFTYDCSIEEGIEQHQTGDIFFWPYTLDNGSPGNKALSELDIGAQWEVVKSYPGLWEIPCYYFILPADSMCEQYGITKGLRQRTHENVWYFDTTTGKLTGLDYNVIDAARTTDAEFLGILKYTFDLHYNGNRCPMTVGSHSKYYSENTWATVLENFIDYALTKSDVRIITTINLVQWMRNPTGLDPSIPTSLTSPSASQKRVKQVSINITRNHHLAIRGLSEGAYRITLHNTAGKTLCSFTKQIDTYGEKALCAIPLSSLITAGCIIVTVQTNENNRIISTKIQEL